MHLPRLKTSLVKTAEPAEICRSRITLFFSIISSHFYLISDIVRLALKNEIILILRGVNRNGFLNALVFWLN